MYLERLMPGLLGSQDGIDTFNMMQQQGVQQMQNGMQAQNSMANARANAMQDFQKMQAQKEQGAKSLLSLGLNIATGGLGGSAAGAAEGAEASTIGDALANGIADAAGTAVADMAKNGISQLSTALSPVANAGRRYFGLPQIF